MSAPLLLPHADSTLTIDVGAIVRNYKILAAQAAKARCAAVVKANAYGLGIGTVAPALYNTGCRDFFVATLDEGIELRGLVASDANIFVFHGLQASQEGIFTAQNLIPVLNDVEQIERWERYAKTSGKRLPCILHVDTGMNRLGIGFDALKTLKPTYPGLDIRYIMSHLACASGEHVLNKIQLERTRALRSHFNSIPMTLANSAGIFLGEDYHCDLVRPGVALYGVNPTHGNKNPMHPVVTLSAKIIQLRTLTSEQSVGYGATRTLAAGSRLATIPVGYADGYLRSLGNQAAATIGNTRVSVVGRISMDLIVLDVTQVPESTLSVGTEVELIGRHNPVDLIAQQAGTIGYEILTRLGSRFRRTYIEG